MGDRRPPRRSHPHADVQRLRRRGPVGNWAGRPRRRSAHPPSRRLHGDRSTRTHQQRSPELLKTPRFDFRQRDGETCSLKGDNRQPFSAAERGQQKGVNRARKRGQKRGQQLPLYVDPDLPKRRSGSTTEDQCRGLTPPRASRRGESRRRKGNLAAHGSRVTDRPSRFLAKITNDRRPCKFWCRTKSDTTCEPDTNGRDGTIRTALWGHLSEIPGARLRRTGV